MASKMIAVKDLKQGDILSDTVLTATGRVLLVKDVELTPRTISLLNTWDVSHVYIIAEEEKVVAVAVNTDLTEACMKFFQEYDSVVTMASQAFDFVRNQKKVPVQFIKDTSFGIYSTVLEKGSAVMDYLLVSDYKLAHEVTRHSVMVSYIAGMIGRQMRMSEEDIKGVTLAALLHDIGKMVYAKSSDTNVKAYEDSTSRLHVVNALALLKDMEGLSRDVYYGIVQHHELIDGSGFPLGLGGANIHQYAKIIAVADLFHLQAYKGDYSNPFPVLERLSKEMFEKFDTAICQSFINKVRDSLLHNYVVLSDGQTAEVIYYHSNTSCMPLVRTPTGQIIDLAVDTHIKVERLAIPDYFPPMDT